MIHALSLESFDDPEASASQETTIYQDGYDQGLADARKSQEADQSELTIGLVQAISDLEFKYVEARAEITASLAPMFEAVTQKVLPQCISHSFIMQITAILNGSTAQCASIPLKIAVHPSQKDAVALALKQSVSNAVITADDQLSNHAAWICHDREETHFDMDAVAKKIEVILSTISQLEERDNING